MTSATVRAYLDACLQFGENVVTDGPLISCGAVSILNSRTSMRSRTLNYRAGEHMAVDVARTLPDQDRIHINEAA